MKLPKQTFSPSKKQGKPTGRHRDHDDALQHFYRTDTFSGVLFTGQKPVSRRKTPRFPGPSGRPDSPCLLYTSPDQEPRHRPHQRAQERTGRSAQINVKRLAIAFEFVVVRHLDVRHRCFGRQMHQGNERLSRLRGCGTVDPDAAGGGLDRRSGTGLGKLRRKLRYLFFPDTCLLYTSRCV